MSRSSFRIVYDVLVHGIKLKIDNKMLKNCTEIAIKNKVLLHFLRSINAHNETRFREEAKYIAFLEGSYLIADALWGLDYVFFKFRKPIIYVPSDVDILITRRHVGKAVTRLKNKGFRIKVVEPYCITMARRNFVVDLYVYPTIGGVIYLDASKLIKYAEYVSLNGLEVPTLKTYAEAVVAIAHAIYKERIYTLNDYITVKKWFTWKALRLARELNCINAVAIAMNIHELVEKRKLILPYKIPIGRWFWIFVSKAENDPLTRATMLNLVRSIRDPRFNELVLLKLMRETY